MRNEGSRFRDRIFLEDATPRPPSFYMAWEGPTPDFNLNTMPEISPVEHPVDHTSTGTSLCGWRTRTRGGGGTRPGYSLHFLSLNRPRQFCKPQTKLWHWLVIFRPVRPVVSLSDGERGDTHFMTQVKDYRYTRSVQVYKSLPYHRPRLGRGGDGPNLKCLSESK